MSGRGLGVARRLALLVLVAVVSLLCTTAAYANPTNTSPPQILGGTTDPNGQMPVNPPQNLSLAPGSWSTSSPDGLTYAYQWQSCSYPNVILGDGAVAYFRLDEGFGSTSATDVSGFSQPPATVDTSSGNHVSTGQDAGAVAGDSDAAYTLTHAPLQTYVDSGYSFTPSDFSTGTSPASIEAWVKPSVTPSSDAYVAGFGSDTGGDSSLDLELHNTGSVVRVAAFEGAHRFVATSGSIPVGSWTHLALTYDGTWIRLYQNGSLVGTFGAPGALSLIPSVARIDAAVPATWSNQSFNGSLDEVAFYDAALDQPTIASHASAGTDATSAVRCNDIPGATSSTFTPTSDLAGTQIRGQVEATDDDGVTAAWTDGIPVEGSVTVQQPPDLTGQPESGAVLVTGTVTDATGLPVVGARVSIYNDLPTETRVADPVLAETYTDEFGNYTISYPDPGPTVPLLNLLITARGDGVGTMTYVTRQYDENVGQWLDDAGATPGGVSLVLPAAGTNAAFAGPSRSYPIPCPIPRKTRVAGPTPGIVEVGDVHTWTFENAQLTYARGTKTTVNIAASLLKNANFVTTSATASYTGGYSVSQQYPMRGPSTNLAETTAASAAEYKNVSALCVHTYYTVEPYAWIGGTTNPRTVSAGSNGHCPTRLSSNSTYAVPNSRISRSSGKGFTYSAGFGVSFAAFSINLSVRTDWTIGTTETWWPQSGGGNKLWFCGDGSSATWQTAQRIYQGPWTN